MSFIGKGDHWHRQCDKGNTDTNLVRSCVNVCTHYGFGYHNVYHLIGLIGHVHDNFLSCSELINNLPKKPLEPLAIHFLIACN